MLYCRLIYTLSMLYVRLTIKVKVGYQRAPKWNGTPTKQLGRVTLKEHGKKLFACRLQLERGLRNNIELLSLEVWEKGVTYKSPSHHWFIVPFAVRRLNCRIRYKLWYIYLYATHWQDWYLTLTKFEKRSVLVAMGLLELPDLRQTGRYKYHSVVYWRV